MNIITTYFCIYIYGIAWYNFIRDFGARIE